MQWHVSELLVSCILCKHQHVYTSDSAQQMSGMQNDNLPASEKAISSGRMPLTALQMVFMMPRLS